MRQQICTCKNNFGPARDVTWPTLKRTAMSVIIPT